ncbi:DUF6345 domain-containing protein [Streptomyces sp. NBC_00287]|uniref:DUF6345 domain-containing protein n=1 Tax=Streptomyces sp. NBC_00287 TaxID=2975702 RepID=UPI002E2E0348|nr:DUF6345 domain-containing protein [Streptomyces sp. NBC_00287]
MADFTPVQYGAAWNSAAAIPGTECGFHAVPAIKNVAVGFADRIQKTGHSESFRWGNANAWATDFEHPERNSTGMSLHFVDDVHLMYFAGHGAEELAASFASDHFGCRAFYKNMRLGVKKLRWLVLDVCDAVTFPVPDSVVRVWSAPLSGDSSHPQQALSVLCTFVKQSFAGLNTERGDDFAVAVSRGTPVGTAWLDSAFARSGSQTNTPVVIACGLDANDAMFRRDRRTLADRDVGPVPARFLSMKWRS